MLQSIPPRRGRFWLASRALIKLKVSPASTKPSRKVPGLTPQKPNPSSATITRLPVAQISLPRAVAIRLVDKLQDDKGRAQLLRMALLILPIVLFLVFVTVMVLGWLAQAQASQSGNVGLQAEFQRQQLFHASLHVPLE
jgi:hypothetical protein